MGGILYITSTFDIWVIFARNTSVLELEYLNTALLVLWLK